MIVNYQDLLDWVQSMMKTIQDNNVTDHISAAYTENNYELLWPVG